MSRVRHSGFTLIELLTVIAIIAILTAIIFPVFATVRENARQTTSLSNMHQISTALAQFQLDNHKYPDVLFGYVYRDGSGKVVPMDKALAQAQADYNNGTGNPLSNPKLYFPGLYPEYIKDVNAFTDPNNDVKDLTKDTGNLSVNVLCPSSNDACQGMAQGVLVKAADTQTLNGGSFPFPHDFYIADAYDASPMLGTTANTFAKDGSGNLIYVPRYQSSWTSIDNALNCDNNANAPDCTGVTSSNGTQTVRNDYLRQMRWKDPPADTYVTCTTYHVPNADKVLVLWEGGAARKYDPATFLATGLNGASQADVADISAAGGVSPANFWKTPLTR